jgi:virginiamycin A acetyltransferase
MNRFSLLRQALKTAIKQQHENNKLNSFNSATSNIIQSHKVVTEAIKGHHITILDGCYVCDKSSIDSYSYIGYNTLISRSDIGRYNSIASNVNIGHGEHPLDKISTNTLFLAPAKIYEILTDQPCIIEHDVWIGVNSTIKRGVTIGTGAVIGANSFVNADVPPFAIVAGSPARILKYRFDEDKIERILLSKWWEHDLEQAKLIIEQLEAGA